MIQQKSESILRTNTYLTESYCYRTLMMTSYVPYLVTRKETNTRNVRQTSSNISCIASLPPSSLLQLSYQLCIKKLCILCWKNHCLNKQVQHLDISLSVQCPPPSFYYIMVCHSIVKCVYICVFYGFLLHSVSRQVR